MYLVSKRKYFDTLDALRFFAFFAVFLSHCPLKEVPYLNYFSKSGGIGVSFFFVLSGFLISYILLSEKQQKKINLKNFFARRILRIWPLFYGLILFAWGTPYLLDFLNLSYSSEGYKPNWLSSILFLENYQIMLQGSFPNVSPLGVMWSVCIEEHFYIIWGVLFYTVSTKNIPKLIIGSIIIANIFRLVYHNLSLSFVDVFTNLDLFAYGAIPAYLIIKKPKVFSYFEKLNPLVKYIFAVITVTTVVVISNNNFNYWEYYATTILGILFTIIIIFTILKTNKLFISNTSIFSKLGKYTYGLYLYHTIFIKLTFRTIDKFVIIESTILRNLTISLFALILSIIVSIISFYLFENQFIKLKKYFYKS